MCALYRVALTALAAIVISSSRAKLLSHPNLNLLLPHSQLRYVPAIMREPATYNPALAHSFFNDHFHEPGERRLRNIENELLNGGHSTWHAEIRTIMEKH